MAGTDSRGPLLPQYSAAAPSTARRRLRLPRPLGFNDPNPQGWTPATDAELRRKREAQGENASAASNQDRLHANKRLLMQSFLFTRTCWER